ncbi:MAG TPA: asparagine synthase-related protein [Mycobacteriales bacterium]|nr:asparagine synthase-related protein [Mycobacteriales bacterium]
MTATPLRPLELASGVLVGASPIRTFGCPADLSPLDALEQAVRPALQRPPCLVSFSGGIDSSLVLAVATRLARREGHPLPVPVTLRHQDAPRAEESAWQDLVVRACGLSDWQQLHPDRDELDVVGPVARPVLRAHGVRHPANAYLHAPMLERARGGSLLTGLGGDQVLGGSYPRLARRPTAIRRQWQAMRLRWLRPGPARRLAARSLAELATFPRHRYDRQTAWHVRRRNVTVAVETMELLAADAGAQIGHPLISPVFVGALIRAGAGIRDTDRNRTVRRFFADVLPAELVARQDKAVFSEVIFRGVSRDLRNTFDPGAIDENLVDVTALRDVWRSEPPPYQTALLMQHAWLAADGEKAGSAR